MALVALDVDAKTGPSALQLRAHDRVLLVFGLLGFALHQNEPARKSSAVPWSARATATS